MNQSDILKHVDHTQLKAVSSWEDIQILCEEAIQYKTASVCIPPCYVARIKKTYQDKLNICTVIGFPLGYNTTATKIYEATEAIKSGANEIDMVINISDVKNQSYDLVLAEISQLKAAIGNHILKVIIETCYLTEEEKIELCKIVTISGADYIKTSTGFGTNGATLQDIQLFKDNIGKSVKIKAAGGIKNVEDLISFLEEGCNRLGTSSAISILNNGDSKGY